MPPSMPMLSKISRNSEDKDSNFASPRRISGEARETANRMLSPVLSRTYEQQREELRLSGARLATCTTKLLDLTKTAGVNVMLSTV